MLLTCTRAVSATAAGCADRRNELPEENVMHVDQATAVPAATVATLVHPDRYSRCIAASKRIRWDIEHDVIRDRHFDFSKKFLPDGLSRVDELAFLNANDRRLLSQVQGRTYANIFGLVERFIAAKVMEVSRDHWLGNQKALEALVRFTDEELKHQELFRRIEAMTAEGMPAGYEFAPEPNGIAAVVLSKSTWAVLGLTLHIELFTQEHYRESIEPDAELSELYKDVFFYHWREESQHAILDELEWVREDARLNDRERDQAVDELIELVGAVDGILQAQAAADAAYFNRMIGFRLSESERQRIEPALLKAYRWQYIVSGLQQSRFNAVLSGLVTVSQQERIGRALEPIMGAFTAH
jgi:hypothetical protein